MVNNFDVDEYFLNATYLEVMKNSPDTFSYGRYPTIYSPDKKSIYFSSCDEIFDTNDIDGLKQLLQRLSETYEMYSKQQFPFIKLHKIRIDCFEVCNLIARQVENPEDYHDPDSYLTQMNG